MTRRKGAFSPVSLCDVYAQLGEYSAKFLIDTKISLANDKISVAARNSDGAEMAIEFKRWGTKLIVEFVIDEKTPDGIAVIDIMLSDGKKAIREKFDFWVIKP